MITFVGLSKPMWRNWQTHQTQNLAVVTSYRFDSGHRHKGLMNLRICKVFFVVKFNVEKCNKKIIMGKLNSKEKNIYNHLRIGYNIL